MRLTVKSITKAVAERTGVKPEYIELYRATDDGQYYYWGGKAGSCFLGQMTFSRINSVTLERWIEDFEYRVKESLNDTGNEYATFNEYIESHHWDDL